MAALIDEIQKWLNRHKVDPGETRKEGAWFVSKDGMFDSSNCSGRTKATNSKSKGILVSKCRLSKRNTWIPRLELVSGHIGANLARNLTRAVKRLITAPVIVIWMDSLVLLYWILNPGKPWKTFVSNRVKKIAEITEEVGGCVR